MPLQIPLNCSGRLTTAIDTTAASLFPLSVIGFLMSAICSGSSMEMDEPHFLYSAAETSFLKFKDEAPFNKIFSSQTLN
jgi:hypothetical protein